VDRDKLNSRLEQLTKIIVDETRLKFTDNIAEELFARAIIQIISIRVEREEDGKA